MLNVTDAQGILNQWRLHFLEFDIDIFPRAGFRHQATDALSHLPIEETDKSPLEEDLSLMFINLIDGIKHDGSFYISEYIITTSMHVNSEPTEF